MELRRWGSEEDLRPWVRSSLRLARTFDSSSSRPGARRVGHSRGSSPVGRRGGPPPLPYPPRLEQEPYLGTPRTRLCHRASCCCCCRRPGRRFTLYKLDAIPALPPSSSFSSTARTPPCATTPPAAATARSSAPWTRSSYSPEQDRCRPELLTEEGTAV
jgi:hypothetical protein